MGLLRRACARSLASVPLRGAPSGPIVPITDRFPWVSSRVMGERQGWFNGPYSVWYGCQGHLHRPPMVVGGIHNPEIDPMQHFNCQDRFQTVPLSRMAQLYLQNMFSARIALGCVVWPVLGILFWVWLDMRREPMEARTYA